MSADLDQRLRPYVAAAVHSYGAAVLTQEQDTAVDSIAGIGRQLLQRIFGVRTKQDAPEALVELAESLDDEDLQAVLRVQIRKVLAADKELARQIRAILDEVHAGTTAATNVTASGKRSIAAHTISGVASTGDDAEITR